MSTSHLLIMSRCWQEAAALKSRSKQEMVVTDHTKTYRDRDMLAARFAVQVRLAVLLAQIQNLVP